MNRKVNIKVKVLLLEQNLTQRQLARKFKVSDVAICRIILGTMNSNRLKRLIAKELNVDYKELWQEKEAA